MTPHVHRWPATNGVHVDGACTAACTAGAGTLDVVVLDGGAVVTASVVVGVGGGVVVVVVDVAAEVGGIAGATLGALVGMNTLMAVVWALTGGGPARSAKAAVTPTSVPAPTIALSTSQLVIGEHPLFQRWPAAFSAEKCCAARQGESRQISERWPFGQILLGACSAGGRR
jgi:hypothetical protein